MTETRSEKKTEPKKEGGANLPLIGLGLILAAGAGVVVGWYAHKPEKPAEAVKTAQATKPAAGKPTEAAAKPAADGATEALAGPCADYVKRICEAAGEQSGDCQALRKSAELLPAAACEAAQADIAPALARIAEAKKSCDDLQNRLCRDLGEDTETCKMVREQTPRFPPDRCKSMLERYEPVLKDLRGMEARNKPVAPDLWAKLSATDGPSFGPPDAKVVVVEFSDFLCPFCKYAAESVEKNRERYAGVVRFVFRQFPLPMHGPNARLAAQASLAANAQGKCWQMHDALFANQGKLGEEGRALIEQLAQQIGLDMTAFRAALDGNTFDAAINADMALGQTEIFEDVQLVEGTPSLFLNGKRMNVDPRNPEMFARALDEALIAAGVPIPPPPAPAEASAPAGSTS